MAVVAAPGVERAHAVDHASYALVVFALPELLASLIEAPIAFASDRVPRRRVLIAALVALATALSLCAAAESAWILSLGLGLAGAASGVACSTAQAELVTRPGARADRAMSEWVKFGAAGDILSPLTVAAALAFGASFRTALLVVAALLFAQALLVCRSSPPLAETGGSEEPTSPAPSLRETIGLAFARPRLWWLLAASTTCSLLDEIVAALCALRLSALGWPDSAATSALAAISIGAFVSAWLVDRLLVDIAPSVILAVSALAAMIALVLFVFVATPWALLLALVLLGAASAPHYALVQAAAYEVVPGLPGLVNAASQMFVIAEIALPLVVGLVASNAGVEVAILCLAAQPICMLIVAADQRNRGT